MKSFALLCSGMLLLTACGGTDKKGYVGHDPAQTGMEYAPDMYHTIPLDPYSQMGKNPYTRDGKNLMSTVAGTIARGKMGYDFPYANNPDAYEQAGRELTNPIADSKDAREKGKYLYTQYCQHCHGPNGDGAGKVSVAAGGPFAGVPSYYDDSHKNLPVGKMFFSITYGRNQMGSHASQLNPTERWQVILYVQELQRKGLNLPDPLEAPAAPAAATETAAK